MGLLSFLEPSHKPSALPRYQVVHHCPRTGATNVLGVYETLYDSHALDMAITDWHAKGRIYRKCNLESVREGFY